MVSEQLRKLASEIRLAADSVESRKMLKCAQVLRAADALNRLQKKVRHAS